VQTEGWDRAGPDRARLGASNSKTRGKGTANGKALRAVFLPSASALGYVMPRLRRWWVGGMSVVLCPDVKRWWPHKLRSDGESRPGPFKTEESGTRKNQCVRLS
jgi:hypothetical protein